jgi:HEAT repeat protein
VRALAARAAGLELDQASAPALVSLLEDPAPEVRMAARQALVRLNGGADLGPSVSAWKERFK